MNSNGNGNGKAKKRRKRIIIWSSVVVVFVALVVTGVVIASAGGTKIDPSKLAKVEKGDLAKSVVATGKIEPITKVEVKSKASGIVKKLYVDYGDRVKKGQMLAELDREEIQARVDQARAQVEASEASLNGTRADLVRAIAELKELRILKLGYSNITGDGLRILSGLQQVERLGLEACPRIGDEAAAELANWKSLKYVDLQETKVTEKGVEILREGKPGITILGGGVRQ